MSFPSEVIECTQCQFSCASTHAGVVLEYRDSSGLLYRGFRQDAWCQDCQMLRDVEVLPSLEELEARVNEAEVFVRGTSWERLMDRLRGRMDARRTRAVGILERRRLAVRWRGMRRLPPRCLSCGGTHWSLLSWRAMRADGYEEAEGFVHTCGGTLVRHSPEPTIRLNHGTTTLVLSAEGEVLGRRPGDDSDFFSDSLTVPGL